MRHLSPLFALLVLLAARGASAEQPTLSGRWSASGMSVKWNVGDWGEACGPKPGGSGAPAGIVTIKQAGGELTISGGGRTWRTTECWESLPGMRRVSHSGGARAWRSVCQSASGDPRQATVITAVSASDAYMSFDETGQYQFVIKGQNCTASVRRSRSFKLVQREGEAPVEPTPDAGAEAAKPRGVATRATRCTDPGPPARLEVRPSRKLLRPGESFTFRALVLDARSCLLPTAPTWTLANQKAPVKFLGPGTVQVAEGAAEGEIQLLAKVAGQSARVLVEVVSLERYEAMLRQGGFDEQGEIDEAAVAVIASSSIGARSTVRVERARSRRTLFVAIVGAAAVLLGVLGLLVVSRSRRRAPKPSEPPGPAGPPGGPAMQVERVPAVCPTCREEYPPETQFCPRDGNRLLPLYPGSDASRGPTGGVCPVCGQGYDPGISVCPVHEEELVPHGAYASAQEPSRATTKICPICGTTYPGDGQFCGADGAALVPVN